MKGKMMRRMVSALLAIVMVVSTCIQDTGLTVKAVIRDDSTFTVLINGELDASQENEATIEYGQKVEKGANALVTVKDSDGDKVNDGQVIYYYLPTSIPKDELGYTEWNDFIEDGKPVDLEPGTYYLGVVIDAVINGSAEEIDLTDGRFTFTVTDVAFKQPDNLIWADRTAKWNKVTRTTTEYEIKDTDIKNYTVSLYKDGESAPVGSYTTDGNKTELNLSSYIEAFGYGTYTFSVTANAKDESAYYKNSADSDISNGTYVYEDTDSPEVANITSENKKLNIEAKDNGSGIAAYAISTKNQNELTEADWNAVSANPGEMVSESVDITDIGKYYLYVKDNFGNITKSDSFVSVSRVTLDGYYDIHGSQPEVSEFIVFMDNDHKDTYTLPVSADMYYQGHSFDHWQVDGKTTVAVVATENPTEYTAVASWTKSSIAVSVDPLDGIEKTYDGKNSTISVHTNSIWGFLYKYQWYYYKDNVDDAVEISGATGSSISVKDVADSGHYYAVVSFFGDTYTTPGIPVNITKAELTVEPEEVVIRYGDNIDDALEELKADGKYTYSGLVNGETKESLISSGKLIEGSFTTDYKNGDPVTNTTNDITYKVNGNGFEADNYVVNVKSADFVVLPKETEIEIEVTNKTVDGTEIAGNDDGFYYTGDGIEPNVVVTMGGETLDPSQYTVEYSNNVVVGTATVKVTLKGNLSGEKTTEYSITKAPFESEVFVSSPDPGKDGEPNWLYGETNITTDISVNPGSGEVTYYFQGVDEEGNLVGDPTTVAPTDAGKYKVWAVIAESDWYQECTTEMKSFEIEKRIIKIRAGDGHLIYEWEYDGHPHSITGYTITSGSVAGMDSIKSVEVIGSITEVGEKDATVKVTFSKATNENNYDVQITPITLKVTSQQLPLPVKEEWSSTEPGKATWIAVTRDGVNIKYRVRLYRDGSDEVIKEVTTGNLFYDFSEDIRKDSTDYIDEAENLITAPFSYRFDIQVVPEYADGEVNNLQPSNVSEKTDKLNTAYVVTRGGTGIEWTSIDGISNDSIGGKVLIAGESATISAKEAAGYSLADVVWAKVDSSETNISIDSNISATTTVSLSANLDSSRVINLHARANNNDPEILDFVGTNVPSDENPYGGYDKVNLTISADDAGYIAYYALASVGAPADMKQSEITAWAATQDINWIATNTTESTFNKVEQVSEEGTYYLYIKDDSGNVVISENPVNVYKIRFNKGNENAQGTMLEGETDDNTGSYWLKANGTSIVLPANKYTLEDYQYTGWKSDSGAIYSDRAVFSENRNAVLNAQWTNVEVKYDVKFYLMDSNTGEYPTTPYEVKEYTSIAGSTIHGSDINVEYVGYNKDASKDNSILLKELKGDDEKQVIAVYYEPKTYTIKYKYYSIKDSEIVERTQTYKYGQTVTELAKPEEEGCTFIGWEYGESGILPETMPNHDISATGRFVSQQAKIGINYFTQRLTANGNNYSVGNAYDLQSTELLSAYQGDKVKFDGKTVTITEEGGLGSSTYTVKDIEGFTLEGGAVSYQVGSGSSKPASTAANHSDVTVKYVMENGVLVPYVYLNFYYSRNSYDLTLNVYMGSRYEGKIAHTESQKMYYQQPIPAGFASADADKEAEWLQEYKTNNQGADVDKYVLAKYIDWSLGETREEASTIMPNGNVTVTRQFINNYELPYIVHVYSQDADGQYTLKSDRSLSDFVGNRVLIGAMEDKDSTPNNQYDTYINADVFKVDLGYSSYYEFDKTKTEGLAGTISSNENEQLELSVYFKRKASKATITYVYNDNILGDGVKNQKIVTVVKTGFWGGTFNIEPLRYFGEGTDETYGDYQDARVFTNEDAAAEAYDYKNNNYLVSYDGSYYINDYPYYPNYRYYAASDITDKAGQTCVFGWDNGADRKGTNITVYYTRVRRENTYEVDVMIRPVEVENYSEHRYSLNYYDQFIESQGAEYPYPHEVSTQSFPMTATLKNEDGTSTTYQVKVANMADIYEWTSVDSGVSAADIAIYPGLQTLNWNNADVKTKYNYVTSETGTEVNPGYTSYLIDGKYYYIKNGFTPVDIDGTTYFKKTGEDGKNYVYYAWPENQLIAGEKPSLSYRSVAKLGYTAVNADVAKDSENLTDSLYEPYKNFETDPRAEDVLLHESGFATVVSIEDIKSKHETTFYFENPIVDNNIVYHFDSSAYSTRHTHGTVVIEDDTKVNGESVFPVKDGYHIVWFDNYNYTGDTYESFVATKARRDFYGRYEKDIVENKGYVHYELPNKIELSNGDHVDYLTIDTINDPNVKDDIVTIESDTAEEVTYKNEYGQERTASYKTKYYYYNDNIVLVEKVIPSVIKTEVEFKYSANDTFKANLDEEAQLYTYDTVTGFQYSKKDTNNILMGYVDKDALEFHAYVERLPHKFTIVYGNTETDNAIDVDTVFGEIVNHDTILEQTDWITVPEREGYLFNGWKFYKVVYEKDENGFVVSSTEEEIPAFAVDAAHSSNVSITMPDEDIVARAQWVADIFPVVMTDYYPNSDNKYYKNEIDEYREQYNEFRSDFYYNYLTDEQKANYQGTHNDMSTYDDIKIKVIFDGKEYTAWKFDGSGTIVDFGEQPKKADGTPLGEDGPYAGKAHVIGYVKYVQPTDDEKVFTATQADLNATETVIYFKSESEYNALKHSDLYSATMYEYDFTNVMYKESTLEIKANKNDPTDYTGGEFTAEYGMEMNNYMASKPLDITVSAKATDNGTLNNENYSLQLVSLYKFNTSTYIKAVANAGFTFDGWYNYDDVIDAEGKVIENYKAAEKFCNGNIETFNLLKNEKLIALFKPITLDNAAITLSGKQDYLFGYANSGENVINASVNLGDNPPPYRVNSYSWYIYNEESEDYELVAGETTATFHFPIGQEVGDYTYKCKMELVNPDNGRVTVVESDTRTLTVSSSAYDPKVTAYVGTYDSKPHTISVVLDPKKYKNDRYEIYYSKEEITADNYKELLANGTASTDVTSEAASYTNVSVDKDGNVIPQTVYYYIHSLDGNRDDNSGSSTVTINPKSVTLTATGSFTKVYDGTNIIGKDDSNGLELRSGVGKYYTISGLTSADSVDTKEHYTIIYDSATYNTSHVSTATGATIKGLRLVRDGSTDYNYAFNGAYNFTFSANITPLEVDVDWKYDNDDNPENDNADFDYVYNSTDQGPIAVVNVAEATDAQKALIAKMDVNTTGYQTNTGSNYVARAMISGQDSDDPDAPLPSDFTVKEEHSTHEYNIVPRKVTITPVDDTVTYDKTAHTLESFELSDTEEQIPMNEKVTVTIQAKANKDYTNVGVYDDIKALENAKILEKNTDTNKTTDATENYDITFATGTLTIVPRIAVVSGIKAEDKTYDTTTDVTLNFNDITLDRIIDGDDVTLNTEVISGAFASPEASKKPDKSLVNLTYDSSVLIGKQAGNYEIVFDNDNKDLNSQTTTSAYIEKKVIKVGIVAAPTVYGDSFDDTYTVTYTTMPDGSELAGNIVYSVKNNETATDKYNHQRLDVGTYNMVPDISGLKVMIDGKESSDYVFELEEPTVSLKITQRTITIEKTDEVATKTYDGTTAVSDTFATEYPAYYQFKEYDGRYILAADDKYPADVVKMNYTAAAYDNENATVGETGAKIVTLTGLTVDNSNYRLAVDTLDANGKIDPRPITIKAKDVSIVYGSSYSNWTSETINDTALANRDKSQNINTLLGLTYTCDYNTTVAAKRNVGKYAIIAACDNSNSNYTVTVVNDNEETADTIEGGVLTVTPKALSITAKDQEMTYGDLVPANELLKVEGWVYDDDKLNDGQLVNAVKTAAEDGYTYKNADGTVVEVKYNSLPGTYSINANIPTANRTFMEGNYKVTTFNPGTLTINKKEIYITGVTVDDKIYDSTTIVKPEQIKTTDKDGNKTITYNNALEEDVTHLGTDLGLTIAAEYTDPNVGLRDVTLGYTLGEYLDARYVLGTSPNTKSNIIAADVTIKADDLSVKYGTTNPPYTVSYEGFKNEDDKAAVIAALGTTDYTSLSKNNSTPYDAKALVDTQYTVTPVYEGHNDRDIVLNYRINIVPGTLTVITNMFAEVNPYWTKNETTDVVTLAKWEPVSDISDTKVDYYRVTLYKDGEQVQIDDGHGNWVDSVKVSATEPLEYDMATSIRNAGPGAYKVGVSASQSDETALQVSDSPVDINTGVGVTPTYVYAANVKTVFNTNAPTTNGKLTDANGDVIYVDQNNAKTYVMIAGESASITAGIKNPTGYTVSSSDDSSYLEIKNGSVRNTADNGQVDGSNPEYYDADLKLSADLDNSNDITVTVTLAYVPATLTADLTSDWLDRDTNINVPYGYVRTPDAESNERGAETAPWFIINSDVVAGKDTVTKDGYTYSYTWTLMDSSKKYRSVDRNSSEASTTYTDRWQLEEALKVYNGYNVKVEVTATRNDNGQTAKATKTLKFAVVKASLNDKITYLDPPQEWYYGEARKHEELKPHGNLGLAPMPETNFEYILMDESKKEAYDGNRNDKTGWTTGLPEEVGVYYVRANIPETTSYDAFTTKVVKVEVKQNKLTAPTDVTMLNPSANNPTYGTAMWNPVLTATSTTTDTVARTNEADTFKENAGGSTHQENISVTYKVELKKLVNGNYETVHEFVDSTAAHKDDVKVITVDGQEKLAVDYTDYITQTGTYKIVVTAISNDGDEIISIADSEPASTGDEFILVIDGKVTIRDVDGNSLRKVYDGQDVILDVELDKTPSANAKYVWYKDDEVFKTTTGPELHIWNVADSGRYTCIVEDEGNEYLSTYVDVEITKAVPHINWQQIQDSNNDLAAMYTDGYLYYTGLESTVVGYVTPLRTPTTSPDWDTVGDEFTYTYTNSGNTVKAATEIGSYVSEITDIANPNYTLVGYRYDENTVFENSNTTANWSINYLDVPDELAYLNNGTLGNNQWFTSTSVDMMAPSGYTICLTRDGEYADRITITKEGTTDLTKSVADGGSWYYLKQNGTGFITNYKTEALWTEQYEAKAGVAAGAKTSAVKLDDQNPTGKLNVTSSTGEYDYTTENTTELMVFAVNGITNVITTDDRTSAAQGSSQENASHVYKTYYQIVSKYDAVNGVDVEATYNRDGDWTEYTAPVTLTANDKVEIYTKIVDNAGNTTYLNSKGIVIYTDPEVVNGTVDYVRTTMLDKVSTVKLNGNTIKNISYKGENLTLNEDYTWNNNGEIILKASFLDKFEASETPYILTVSYNPLGETYVEAEGNRDVVNTEIKVNVRKAITQVSIDNGEAHNKIYSRENVVDTVYTIINKDDNDKNITDVTTGNYKHGDVTVEWKVKGANDSTYKAINSDSDKPVNAGDYTVRVRVAGTDYYYPCETTYDFTIYPAVAKINWAYNDGVQDSDTPDMKYTGENVMHTVMGTVDTTVTNSRDGDTFTYTYKTGSNYTNTAWEISNPDYISEIIDLGNPNYVLKNPGTSVSELYKDIPDAEASKTWTITYLETDALAHLDNGILGDKAWFTGDKDEVADGKTDVYLVAPNGFSISFTRDGGYDADHIIISDEGTTEISYWLKQDNTDKVVNVKHEALWTEQYEAKAGVESGAVATEVKIDSKVPSGSIIVKSSSENTITYSSDAAATGTYSTDRFVNDEYDSAKAAAKNVFEKTSVSYTIETADTTSGVDRVFYQLISTDKGQSYDVNGTWTKYEGSVSVPANDKVQIYAKFLDEAGNTTIINSEGIVVYTDAVKDTEVVNYTRTTRIDKTADVKLNGNTIKSIVNKTTGETLDESEYTYEISDNGTVGTITFKKDYLDSLSAGEYNLELAYNPYNEEYKAANTNDVPATTAIKLVIEKATIDVTLTNDVSKVYDGTVVADQEYQVVNVDRSNEVFTNETTPVYGEVTIEYKLKSEPDSEYKKMESANDKPLDAGTYNVRVSIAEDKVDGTTAKGYYKSDYVVGELTITPAVATITWYQNADPYTDGKLTYTAKDQSVTGVITALNAKDTFTIQYRHETVDGTVYDEEETKVGEYVSLITDIGNPNYTLDTADVQRPWSISYLETDALATITAGTLGEEQWFTSNTVTITAPEGFKISFTRDDYDAYSNTLTYSKEGITDVAYYLKKDDNNFITDVKNQVYWGGYAIKAGEAANATTSEIKIDNQKPTETIKITTVLDNHYDYSSTNETDLKKFVKTGLNFKIATDDQVSTTVDAQSVPSKVAKTYYQIVSVMNGQAYSDSAWTEYTAELDETGIEISANDKVVIYAKVVDHAGNTTIINSEGIVIFKDSVGDANKIDYTRTTLYDKSTVIALNGNTVKEIKNGDVTLREDVDYTWNNDGTIEVKGSYLDTLEEGTYTLTVYFHPLSETFDNGDNTTPTDITVEVKKAQPQVTITNITNTTKASDSYSQIYNGLKDTTPVYTIVNTEDIKDIGTNLDITDTAVKPEHGAVTIEYKAEGTDTYVTDIPKNVGKYTARVTVAATKYYYETVTEQEFEIKLKKATVTADNKTKVYGTADPTLTYVVVGEENNEKLDINIERVAGENVGDYTITVSGKDGSTINTNYDIEYVPGTFTITKATPVITLEDATYLYDAEAIEYAEGNANVSINLQFNESYSGEYIYEYKIKGADDSTYTTDTPVNAGDYVVRVTLPESNNYNSASETANITINKRPIVIDVDDKTSEYGQDILPYTYIDAGEYKIASEADKTLLNIVLSSKDEKGVALNNKTNAGVYDIIATYTANDNYIVEVKNDKYTITKITPNLVVEGAEVTYGDPQFNLAVTSKPGESNPTYTSSDESVAVINENTGKITIKEIGETTVTVNMAESTNYVARTEEATVKVNPATPVITLKDKTVTYTGKPAVYAYTSVALVYNEKYNDAVDGPITYKYRVSGSDGAYTDGIPTEAGVYEVVASLDAFGNYTDATATATLTINKAKATVTAANKSKIYGGVDPALTYTVSGAVNGEVLEVEIERAEGEDVGTYEIAVAGKENSTINKNYDITYNNATFTIKPATPTMAIRSLSYVYDGEEVEYETTEGNVVIGLKRNEVYDPEVNGAIEYQYKLKGEDDSAYTSTIPKEVGVYTVKATLPANGNYTAVTKTASITINPATPVIHMSNATYDYDQNAIVYTYDDVTLVGGETYEAGVNAGEVTLQYKVYGAADSTYTTTPPTNAGKYTVKATMPALGNYKAATATAIITINKYPVTVTVEDKEKVYGTVDPELTYVVDGAFASEPLTDITVTRKAGENVGTYAITAKQATGANANYAVTFVPGSLAVTPATPVLELVANKTEYVADGNPATNEAIAVGTAADTNKILTTTVTLITHEVTGTEEKYGVTKTAKVKYFYIPEGSSEPVAGLPKDQGTYQVYAVMDEMYNYYAAESNKVTITITRPTDEFIDVIGFQTNTAYKNETDVSYYGPSFRIVSGVSKTLTVGGKTHKVVGYGTVYDLASNFGSGNYTNMTVGGVNDTGVNTHYTRATSAGNLTGFNDKTRYNYYALTLYRNGIGVTAIDTEYAVRAFAILDDGTYAYSKRVYVTNIYKICHYLYQNSLLASEEACDFVYYNVLNTHRMAETRSVMVRYLIDKAKLATTEAQKVYNAYFSYYGYGMDYGKPRMAYMTFANEAKILAALKTTGTLDAGDTFNDWLYKHNFYYQKKPYEWGNSLVTTDSINSSTNSH